ncbi:transcriptional regulator [Streptomyces anulatus]
MTATVRLTEDVPQRGVRRTGAALLHPDRPLRVVDEHLRVRLPATHPMPLLADVLVAEYPSEARPPYEDPARYAAELADCHPGALVVAVHRGPRCWLRLGGRPRLLVREPGRPVQPWAVWASVAHVWLVAGLDPAAFDPAAVQVVRTVRDYAPASPRSSPDGSVPGGADGESSASGGSSASSRAFAPTASADSDRQTDSYRDTASR